MPFVQSTSRYNAPSADASGVYISTRKYSNGSKYRRYTSVDGDSFDIIAAKTLSDPERYWEIADLNPHVPFPDWIPEGTIIRVPVE